MLIPITPKLAVSEPEDDDLEIGEFQVAEYIIFLLALDTYQRYAEETAGIDDVEDALIKRGLKVLRLADTQIDQYREYLETHLTKPSQISMLRRALNLKVFNPAGAARRALQFRTILTRGGTQTVKGILDNPKYVRQVKTAISASMLEDADKALDVLAAIPLLNIKMRAWIDAAAKQSGSGTFAPSPVDSASNEVAASTEIKSTSIKEIAETGAQSTQVDQESRAGMIHKVQVNATEAARKSLEVNKQPDEPPKESKVVGIATAAAVAAISDPSLIQNIPHPLRNLDDEQRSAALTGGRVRVAAGAGSGKCVRGDTLVRTIRGLIPIQEFADGLQGGQKASLKETVLGLHGPEPTSTVLNEGKHNTIRLTTRLGYQLEGTLNHPILVLRDGLVKWVLLEEILGSDFICIDRRPGLFPESPYRVIRGSFSKITSSKPSQIPDELTPQVSRLLGFIVSEGQVVYGQHSQVNLTTTDEDQFTLYKESVEGIIPKCSVYFNEVDKDWSLRFYCRSNLEALADFGLTYTLAPNKEIPEGILRSPKAIIVEFLRALFDGDGGFHQNTVYYDSSSEKLARQIHTLLLDFGVISRLKFKPNDKNGCWNVSITGDNARIFLREIGFNLKKKQAAAEQALMGLESNPNLDVIPGLAGLFQAVMSSAKGLQNISEHPKYHAFKCYQMGIRNPSRKLLGEFLTAYPVNTEEYKDLQDFLETPWFYDSVDEILQSESEVYDFIVPGTHSFSAGGFVNHNSTTLVARIDYLVKDGRVNPARVMACSFNRKSALELKEKIAKKVGEGASGIQVGTMHSLFAKLIIGTRDTPGFGTREEQDMLRPPRLIAPSGRGVKSISPASLSQAIRNMWIECGPDSLVSMYKYPRKWVEEPPKAKKAGLLLNAWRGNDVTLEQAKALVTSKAEAQAYIWYEMYLGLKGDIPGWRPPCADSKPYASFMNRNRKGGERLGDLDDMLKVLRDILKRDPKAKAVIQDMYDHILVDEAQDLNTIQHQIFAMMSEQITQDSKDKSIWMVGDEKQAIYQFRGAKPELFQALDEGWTTKNIRTNYRCQPEIVEAANALIAHDSDGTVVASMADPRKDRGRASIQVSTPEDNVEAAIDTIGRYRREIDEGSDAENFAVLARTNAELNDFETACIINEIPYIRRGGKGFLEAPESRAVLGFMDLAVGNDYEKMKKSLVATLMKPDRALFLSTDDIEKAVDEALNDVARRERVDVKSIRPDLLLESRYVRILADKLKLPHRLRIISYAKGDTRKGEWMYKNRVDEMESNLRGMSENIRDLRAVIGENKPTEELLNYILDNMQSKVISWDRATNRNVTETTSLRQQITNDVAVFSDDDEEDEEDDAKDSVPPPEIGEEGLMPTKEKAQTAKGLGAVQFLFALSKPNEHDQANVTDPSVAQGFVDKLGRYSKIAESLRIDPDKWEKEQQKLDPGVRREKPPAISLSTVHAVKGAQWRNVTVLMPKGLFPMERKPKEDEPPPDPVVEAARMKAERNLAYVALTRAAVNLEVTCPMNKGVSPFVFDAGLTPGENVPKASLDHPEEVTVQASASPVWIPAFIEEF